MIDHSGHPHPSTPAARAKCRANGGTGSIASTGTKASTSAPKSSASKTTSTKTATKSKTTTTPKKPVRDPDPKPEPKPDAPKPKGPESGPVGAEWWTTPTRPGGSLADIPEARGASNVRQLRLNKIQNALRRGASREFIIANSNMTPAETNAEIDRLLEQYKIPSHVYPRVGKPGATAPDAKTVKPKPAVQVRKSPEMEPPTPTIPPADTAGNATLNRVRERVDVRGKDMRESVDKVLQIQSAQVGDKLARINSIDDNMTGFTSDRPALGYCQVGHVHVDPNIDHVRESVARGRQGKWFVKGGGTGEQQVIAHEIGHALLIDQKMTSAQRMKLKDALVKHLDLVDVYRGQKTLMPGHLNHLVSYSANQGKIRSRVSKYAATNLNELIAEVWTDYTMNPRPSKSIKGLGDAIKDIIVKG